jgi:hypothetical protein
MDGSNLLTAVLCTVVSLFVGVILARVFPELAGLEWGNVAEWLTALAALATAVFAWLALSAWRGQMRGTSRHMAAAEIAEAAQLIKYHFYDARNAFVVVGEFPPTYRSLRPPRSPGDEFMGWQHVFQNRYELLAPQISRLATLRAKAGALLSDECAAGLEALARKARELHGFFQDRLEQIRVGPNIVSQWTDQNWVKRVNTSFQVNPQDHSDPYSLEFEEKFAALMDLIKPFI